MRAEKKNINILQLTIRKKKTLEFVQQNQSCVEERMSTEKNVGGKYSDEPR